jgi:ATP-dependent helicase/nuclease subunit A
LHEILARVGAVSEEDWEAALDQAIKYAQAAYALGQDFGQLRSIVAKVISAKETKRFFFVGKAKVYQEKEIVNRQGLNLRIDRLIVGDDFVWIVDFKSSADSLVDHAKQLNAYRAGLSEIYPDKPVSCYLIFLDGAKVEEVHG